MPAKKLSGRQLAEEILRISDQLEGQFRREFLAAIAGVSSNKELRKLLADIANGTISYGDAIDVRMARVAIPTTKMDEIARKALGSAGRVSGAIVPRLQPRFDVTNPTVVSLARSMSLELSTNLNATLRETLRQIIVDALEGNITQVQAARKIRTHIGLLPAHSQAVDRYYEKMIQSGVKKSLAQKRADQYAERLLNSRAKTIARTEVANAVGKGQSQMWKQMRADGYLPLNAVKVWVTASDERVCPLCGPMNGSEADIDGFWNLGGMPVEYPQASHPNCRCTSVIGERNSKLSKNEDLERDHWLIKHQTGKHNQKTHAGKKARTTKNSSSAPLSRMIARMDKVGSGWLDEEMRQGRLDELESVAGRTAREAVELWVTGADDITYSVREEIESGKFYSKSLARELVELVDASPVSAKPLYRGMKLPVEEIAALVGGSKTEVTFSLGATSSSKSSASGYADDMGGVSVKGVMYRIEGAKAFPAHHFSPIDENEYLVRGKFSVVEVSTISAGRYGALIPLVVLRPAIEKLSKHEPGKHSQKAHRQEAQAINPMRS